MVVNILQCKGQPPTSIFILVSAPANVTGRPAKNLIINYKTIVTLCLWGKKVTSGFDIPRITSPTSVKIQLLIYSTLIKHLLCN